ncbi:hypothetical protein Tco_0307100 [Tanacetum coccineum]
MESVSAPMVAAAKLQCSFQPSRRFNIIYDYDDDDEENTISLNEITSQIPPSIAITPEKSVTFSNPLFDSNEDFTSSDDESLSDEDVPKDKVKFYLNPLFKFNKEYISSDVNPFFNEVLEDIESEDSYVSKLDEPALLVTPLFDTNEDECFDPGGVIDKIKACLTSNSISPEIDDADLTGKETFLLEKLLSDDTSSPLPSKELYFEDLKDNIPNLPPEVFLDDDLRSLEDEPDKE